MGNVDTKFSGEIFRKDHPQILACRREMALLLPVRMRYLDGGYDAGLLVSKNTGDDLWDAYTDGASSGLGTAEAILQSDVDFVGDDTSSQIAVGIFKGIVYKDKLTGYDAAALADLKGRVISDAGGVDLLVF